MPSPGRYFVLSTLDYLLTDAWARPSSFLAKRAPKLGERFHNELRNAPVKAFNSSLVVFETLARVRGLSGWPRILARNRWFQRRVVSFLSSQLSTINYQPILLSYSYTALEPFRYAKAHGWKTLLVQIDPGPVEEEIVRAEHEAYPEFISDWRPAPAEYWQNWRQECELADIIIVISEWSRQALERADANRQKLSVIPLTYEPPADDSATAHEYPERFTPERPLRVLFLGQINLRKGVARLLEAAQALRNEPVEFWMVGPRQCRPPEQLRRLKNVRWFGRVAHANAAQYYRDADIFILPTLSDGFALTQLEAQGHRLPVIATRYCGEVVRDGVNGLVLEEPSSEQIATAVQFCLRNPDRLAAFSDSLRVEERFSLEVLSQNLLAIGSML